MKFLLVIVVILAGVWLLLGRRRSRPPAVKPAPKTAGPQNMLVCSHCGVHLPAAEAIKDAAARPYCSEAHRLAGPH